MMASEWESANTAGKLLVCFDLDGTLMPGTTTILYLAEKLGHLDLAKDLEAKYSTGLIEGVRVARETGPYLAGVPLTRIQSLHQSAPRIGNIGPLVERLHERGASVILASMTWSFFVGLFAKEYGFDSFCGTEMEMDDGTLTGRMKWYCAAEDKLAFFDKSCMDIGISPQNAVAVGDSKSDHPIFRAAGVSIALNADPSTEATATHRIRTGDLLDVLPLIKNHLR